jgi:hypothetical protein
MPADEPDQRALVNSTCHLDHIVQSIAIQPSAGRHDHRVPTALVELVGEPWGVLIHAIVGINRSELEKMRAHRQRRTVVIEQGKRDEGLGGEQSLALDAGVRKQRCDASRRRRRVRIGPATDQTKIRP